MKVLITQGSTGYGLRSLWHNPTDLLATKTGSDQDNNALYMRKRSWLRVRNVFILQFDGRYVLDLLCIGVRRRANRPDPINTV